MGMEKCNYIAMGETKDQVLEMAKDHAMKAHPKEMKESMEKISEEEMDKKMTDHIVEKDEEM